MVIVLPAGVSDARTDTGIIYFKGGPVAPCMLTNENVDRVWKQDNAVNRFCAEVAKAVYDYYAVKPEKAEKKCAERAEHDSNHYRTARDLCRSARTVWGRAGSLFIFSTSCHEAGR
jgi:hypothetical protein